MKKSKLLIIPLFAALTLTGCQLFQKKKNNSSEQSSTSGEISESESSSEQVSSSEISSQTSQSSGDSSLPADKLATFIFYLDYSHSDEPLLKMKWYLNVPLGECPTEAIITEDMASDPLYPHFLGYSRYSSANDESLLWDFSKDVSTSQTAIELYGIWVSE